MRLPRLVLLAAGLAPAAASLLAPPPARAQVAFAPGVGTIPDGVSLSAVPAVSADRRYVRLSINAGFQTVDGFSTVGIPFGVSGLNSGAGNLGAGGLGGLAGGPGAGGGFRSVGVPMGMDGPAPAGFGAGMPSWPSAAGQGGMMPSAEAAPRDEAAWASPRRSRPGRSKPAAPRKPAAAAAKPR